MAEKAAEQNQELLSIVESSATRYQERFQVYISDLKKSISTADKMDAGKILLNAAPVLSYEFPGPRHEPENAKEMHRELTDLKAEVSKHMAQNIQEVECLKADFSKQMTQLREEMHNLKAELSKQNSQSNEQLQKLLSTEVSKQKLLLGRKLESMKTQQDETMQKCLKAEVKRTEADLDKLMQERIKTETNALKSQLENFVQPDVNEMKSELKKQLQKAFMLEGRVNSAVDSINSLEKKSDHDECGKKKAQKKLKAWKERTSSVESQVTSRLNLLSEQSKSYELQIKGLCKFRKTMLQKHQVPQTASPITGTTATTATASSTGHTTAITATATALEKAAVTAATIATSEQTDCPQDVQQRTSFTVSGARGKLSPFITDVKLLPDGLILMADHFNNCLMLFTKHGQHHRSVSLEHRPLRLAVIDTGCCGTSGQFTVAVTFLREMRIQFLEVGVRQIRLTTCLQTSRGYRDIAAVGEQTLAVGYSAGKSVDLMDLTGRVFRQITLDFSPVRMIATADGELVCLVDSTNRFAKVKVTTSQVVYDAKVPKIKRLRGLSPAPNGSLLVTDIENNTLHLLTSQGVWIKQIWAVPGALSSDDYLSNVSMDNGVCVCVTFRGVVYVLEGLC